MTKSSWGLDNNKKSSKIWNVLLIYLTIMKKVVVIFFIKCGMFHYLNSLPLKDYFNFYELGISYIKEGGL